MFYKQIFRQFLVKKDTQLLGLAFISLVIALINPRVSLSQPIYNYFFVVDISQSMNVIDAKLNQQKLNRLQYTQNIIKNIVGNFSCGTKVGIGVFAGVSVTTLYYPIDVCSNYAVILNTIDHLDWRMAWSGNTRLRDGMLSLARIMRGFAEPAKVVFFTDGEEAPLLHAFNTKDLTHFQGGQGWILVGIGQHDQGTPIPKLDDKNQLIGYWANESFAMQPGIAQISEMNIGIRDDNTANSSGDRYLSRLQEPYLQDLAKLVNAEYVRGDNLLNVIKSLQQPIRTGTALFDLGNVFACLTGLLLLYSLNFSKIQNFLQEKVGN